ncbi:MULTISPECIES: hypothetical protein [unclassified Streptomyces]|nr:MULTISPECIES: hypothetical protein [unclassified Streptomyces]
MSDRWLAQAHGIGTGAAPGAAPSGRSPVVVHLKRQSRPEANST